MTHQEDAHDDDSTLGRLYRQLHRVAALREQMRAHPEDQQDRDRLRQWQADRLGRTHRDLLESDRYGPAAKFFLTDLYGPGDCARRDADVMRVMPTAERLLPESGLKVLAQAIELDALSEELDYLMVVALRRISGLNPITAEHYAIAYRAVGEQARREHQIVLVSELGMTLDRLARKPLLGASLKLVSGPAHLAGLGELFSFVERGYQVCHKMGRANEFLETIASRETAIMTSLFNGDSSALG
ncbi:FFLEELY motif protein [Aeromonas allosaccharophila]|uniref:FFLEELY motif protein n=1 Tax=Aeromonas allosaccharophila TaxID=656 RepID=UPI003986982D